MNAAKTIVDWRELAGSVRYENRNLIDGVYADAADGSVIGLWNPYTEEVFAHVPNSGTEDVDRAVRAARRAFRSGIWSKMDPRERMSVLLRLADLIEQHADELAVLDTMCMGKPIRDLIEGDVPLSVLNFRYFAETIDKLEGAVTATASSALHYILRQPLGVVGCIVPWNYPLMMTAWKVAPALAAGNTVVLKPAEQSPLSAIFLARLFLDAGGPPGVLNVVNGEGEKSGKALALHMDVDKIAFTGSVEVGKLMLTYAGQSNMKRVSTECGGKSPQIILDDVEDLELAVDRAVYGIYGNQGEVCSAGSRLLVHREIYDEFFGLFEEKTYKSYAVGDPLDPNTTMGPLVSAVQRDRVLGYIEAGKREGAELRFGGSRPANLGTGFFVTPTLFTGVDNQMTIAREEIFGPVAAAIRVDNLSSAIQIANDSVYGLAASIWTNDIGKAHRAARDLEAGVVWVNCFDHGDMTSPWGGFKQSGNGRDKCFETMMQYTQTKSVWVEIGK